jgi:hypothetical protein
MKPGSSKSRILASVLRIIERQVSWAEAERGKCNAITHSEKPLPITAHFLRLTDALHSIRYKCVFVRRINALSVTAGEAMKPLSSLFSATFLNSRLGAITVALPSSLKK